MARKKLATSWTQSDRDKYRRENPKSNLKDPQPEGGSRKDSYCARSAGIKKCKNQEILRLICFSDFCGTMKNSRLIFQIGD